MIIVYGKKGCGKCEAAKKKLNILGLVFESRDVEKYTTLHEAWRVDGSVDVMAAYSDIDDLPLIQIDDLFYTYSGAMRVLKARVKEQAQELSAVSA